MDIVMLNLAKIALATLFKIVLRLVERPR